MISENGLKRKNVDIGEVPTQSSVLVSITEP